MSERGNRMFELVEELFPICRSITGDGVRETLRIVGARLPAPLALTEVPTGTPVLDWTVPDEWNIRDAWVADASGNRVIDFRRSNLHVVSYSLPVRERMTLAELRPHLHTLPDQPDLIPYRTSYYQPTWGFCLSQRQLDLLAPGEYDVGIDSTLAPGHLTYGELVLPGESADEVLLSTHVCHPSLANDNLSAIAISVAVAQVLAARPRRYTYRFVYAPGTIGAITWLAQNRETAARIRHGMTLVCLGDPSPFTYKRTLAGAAEIDRAAVCALRDAAGAHDVIDFFPYGYTSADNLSFVAAERLEQSLDLVLAIVDVLEGNRRYRSLAPDGEPQLGRRGLYRAMGGTDIPDLNLAMLWVLALADGQHTLLDAAERARMPFRALRRAADLLLSGALLEET